MPETLRENLAPPTQVRPLTSVYCGFGLCPYLLHKKKPKLVGRIWGRAELCCPACGSVAIHEVGV